MEDFKSLNDTTKLIIFLIISGLVILCLFLLIIICIILKKEHKKVELLNNFIVINIDNNQFLCRYKKYSKDYPLSYLTLNVHIKNAIVFKNIKDAKLCIGVFCNMNSQYNEKEFIILRKEKDYE